MRDKSLNWVAVTTLSPVITMLYFATIGVYAELNQWVAGAILAVLGVLYIAFAIAYEAEAE